MAGAVRDIAEPEQVALVDVGIEIGLALHVLDVARPAHEVRHRALRPVAVEHLDGQPARFEIGDHQRQRRGGRPRQVTQRLLVAVDLGADEVVRGGIARIDKNAGRGGCGVDKAVRTRRVFALRLGRCDE
jgi:hypothetical protein